jgi:FKBP-type peptidyl-prolyl cis-trans isomerase FkpA
MKSYFGLIVLFILPVLISCGQSSDPKQNSMSDAEIQESLIRVNQKMNKRESSQIDSFIIKEKLHVTKTGTGLRYEIYKKGTGKQAMPGMSAKLKFTVSLLDGTMCYSSDSSGLESFIIDHDQVESGLHEGIKLLHEGDKAKFILPSHLAHGLIGDKDKIPRRSPIVYDIELIQLTQ